MRTTRFILILFILFTVHGINAQVLQVKEDKSAIVKKEIRILRFKDYTVEANQH